MTIHVRFQMYMLVLYVGLPGVHGPKGKPGLNGTDGERGKPHLNHQ